MNKKYLTEGINHMDMEGLISPEMSIDEYAASMGDDSEIVTLTFKIKGHEPAQDLVDWFERGYKWILDAQVSDGEYTDGIYLVFVELPRRTYTPGRICELAEDLQTLTGLKPTDWSVMIEGETYELAAEILSQVMALSPRNYESKHEDELNEMRTIAGTAVKKAREEYSPEIDAMRRIAGL